MTTAHAARWFYTQPRVSLTNRLSRAYLAELLADPTNAQTLLTQRVPLVRASAIEVAKIESLTSLLTPLLGRLPVNWANSLEALYLAAALGTAGYVMDFSTQSSLPSVFSGPTFSVVNGVLTNTPSVGAELLPDPSLEGTYTAGRCTTLAFNGSPTVAQSADVHSGAKAQEFTAVAQSNALVFANLTPTAGAWYLYSFWGKRPSGTGTNQRSQATSSSNMRPQGSTSAMIFSGASYNQRRTSFITNGVTALTATAFFEAGTSAFNLVRGDDYSMKRLTYADLFALREPTQANVSLKATPNTLSDQSLSGIVGRANAQSSPTSALFAFFRRNGVETSMNISLVELAGGVYTTLIAETGVTEAAGARLELRLSDTTAQLFYNGVQVGANQTVSASGAYHGVCITGGNAIRQFSLAAA